MKKSEIKKLDKSWSEKVKELAGNKCEFCLEEFKTLQAAHIIGRRHRGTRWLLDNGICLCYFHHNQYDEHGPLHEQIRRITIGEERLERLHLIAQSVAKNQDYETIRREIKEGKRNCNS